jgi:ribosomal protein L40E
MKECKDCGRDLEDSCFNSSDDICDQCYAMNPTED